MHLDSTHGAILIGMVVAAVLYGVSCVQALHYYTNQNDPWYIKLAVTAVMIFNTVHQVLIAHTVYTYDITDWGNPAQLGIIVWSLVAEVIFTGLTAFVVQIFLTMRICRLSGRNIYLTAISAMLATTGLVALIVYVVKGFQLKSIPEFAKIKDLAISVNALHAAVDLLIAVILCSLLNISRTGFHKSDVIINRLIVFTVNTGLLTSLCSLGCLITILAVPNTSIYVALFFCLGRFYANTLLATLNARNYIRDVSHGAEPADASVSLRHLSINGRKLYPSTTQQHHHRKLDEENSAVSACRCV